MSTIKQQEAVRVKEVDNETYQVRGEGVYIIKCGKYHKIGRTSSLKERLETFQIANPFDIELVFFLRTDYSLKIEKSLHKLFRAKRHKGEWFEIDNQDILEVVRNIELDNLIF